MSCQTWSSYFRKHTKLLTHESIKCEPMNSVVIVNEYVLEFQEATSFIDYKLNRTMCSITQIKNCNASDL